MSPILNKRLWGTTPDGEDVHLFTIEAADGTRAAISTYGATLVSLHIPTAHGQSRDVVLGYGALQDYIEDDYYFGCTVGRVANRISNGTFQLDETTWQLDCNQGNHHLHGGKHGFGKKTWQVDSFGSADAANGAMLALHHDSPHGQGGYPGNVSVIATFTVEPGRLRIDYRAQTDAPTLLSLTNHTYFNLAGHNTGSCLEHSLEARASRYLPLDAEGLPLGHIEPVEGTPFDFSSPAPLGKRIDDHEQLVQARGYDHYLVLDDPGLHSAQATLRDEHTGLNMTMSTTQPGFQLYTGNYIPHDLCAKEGSVYAPRSGVCLETAALTNAVNQQGFGTIVLRPHETYTHSTVYEFIQTKQ